MYARSLLSSFVGVSFSKVPRDVNYAAHNVTKWAAAHNVAKWAAALDLFGHFDSAFVPDSVLCDLEEWG